MPSSPSSPRPKPNPSFSFSLEATGTHWQVELYDPITADRTQIIQEVITQRIRDFEQTYSRFRPDSFLNQLAQSAGEYNLPADAAPLLDLYRELYDISDGLVTPFIGQTLVDAGYDPEYSFQPQPTLRQPPLWEDTLSYSVESSSLTMKQPAQLDFGGIGKGYLVDLVSDVLREHGYEHYCVDAGGDVSYTNPSSPAFPMTIGLEDPDDTRNIIGTATIAHGALCGSSGNRRRWHDYHHIINPETLTSPENIRAIWATAETALLADGLATALYFVPAAILKKQYTFEYILVMDTQTIEISPDFPGQIFT